MTEVLAAGSGRGPVSRRSLAAALLVVAVAAGGLWWGDRSGREAEFRALAECVRAGRSASAQALAAVTATGEYVRPALRPGVPVSTRRELYRMVADRAAATAAPVARAGAGCAGVPVRRWHGDQLALRAAAATLLDAVTAFLARVRADGRAAFEPDGLAPLEDAVDRALRRAEPGAW